MDRSVPHLSHLTVSLIPNSAKSLALGLAWCGGWGALIMGAAVGSAWPGRWMVVGFGTGLDAGETLAPQLGQLVKLFITG